MTRLRAILLVAVMVIMAAGLGSAQVATDPHEAWCNYVYSECYADCTAPGPPAPSCIRSCNYGYQQCMYGSDDGGEVVK